jgi:hypothetical protein
MEMNKQEMIVFLRDKFKKQYEDITNLRKAISSLTFTTLVLNEMIKDHYSKEQTQAAIKTAAEQMGRLKAMIDSRAMDPGRIWESHFKLDTN